MLLFVAVSEVPKSRPAQIKAVSIRIRPASQPHTDAQVDMGSWKCAHRRAGSHLAFDLGMCLFPGAKFGRTITLAGQTWKSPELQNSEVGDDDLKAALRRFRTGQVARLVASSSSLHSSSVRWALESFSGLQELCLSACGSAKMGAEVQASLDLCTSLRSLHLDRVQLRPPPAKGLRELIVGRQVMRDFWVLGHFPQLRVLNVSSKAFINATCGQKHLWLLKTFKECRSLEEVQVYSAAEVTNEMLAVLMQHVPDLKKFSGCHTSPFVDFGRTVDFPFEGGARRLDAGSLCTEATDAFTAHFPAADIFIDDVYAEMLEEDDSW